jgi:hypothetical protein
MLGRIHNTNFLILFQFGKNFTLIDSLYRFFLRLSFTRLIDLSRYNSKGDRSSHAGNSKSIFEIR